MFRAIGESRDEVVKLQERDEELISRYLQLQEEIKRLEAEAEKIKADICVELGDAEAGVVGNYRVEWQKRERKVLDTKQLKAQRPEIYEQYVSVSVYRVFSVKSND